MFIFQYTFKLGPFFFFYKLQNVHAAEQNVPRVEFISYVSVCCNPALQCDEMVLVLVFPFSV